MEQRIRNLIEFCQAIYHKGNVKELYQRYSDDIQSIKPQDVMLVQYEQLRMGLTPRDMLGFVDKLMNVLHKPLSRYVWKRPEEGTFLYYLIEENSELVKRLDAFKSVIKQNDLLIRREEIKSFLGQVMEYNEHLLKLENILFPYMEKSMERYLGLKIMWSLHDEVRKQWKELTSLLEEENPSVLANPVGQMNQSVQIAPNEQVLNAEIGQLYFNMYGLVQKQELILFPCAAELLDESDFAEMHRQSFDYSFPYISKPELPKGPVAEQGMKPELKPEVKPGSRQETEYGTFERMFRTDTGHLDFEQLELLLNALPVDLSFVDEQDKVAYFSTPKDRVFPRSAAVIGLDVRNCHPPESVHVVETILESFKNGEKDEAEFWIQMKGKFVHIRYVALRDSSGKYRGTLEITQEISALRALEGQKRLLDW